MTKEKSYFTVGLFAFRSSLSLRFWAIEVILNLGRGFILSSFVSLTAKTI